MNSDSESGKIPATEEDPKKLFTYRNPLYNNTSALIPKISNPILPFIHRDPKAGNGRPMEGIQGGSGEVIPPPPGVTPMDHPKGDPPTEKKEEKVTKVNKNVAHPSIAPSKALKFTDNKCTILGPDGLPMANLKIVDSGRGKRTQHPG